MVFLNARFSRLRDVSVKRECKESWSPIVFHASGLCEQFRFRSGENILNFCVNYVACYE